MIIIVDSREKDILPLEILGHQIIIQKLDEGDYASQELLDYEKATGSKTVRIERKKSTSELATNLGKDFKRFEKEMQRLLPYERKIILCEFNYDDILRFPEGSGIPKNKWFRRGKNGRMVKNVMMTPNLMLSRLEYLQNIYEVEIMYAGDKYNAAKKLEEIFNDFTKKT